jgi:YD repeat-containing protein
MGRPWLVTVNANAAAGSADQSITQTQYDLDGNVTQISKLVANNGMTAQSTSMTYDAFGQVVEEQKWNPSGDIVGPDNSIAYRYDEAGNLLNVTDAVGNATSYSYDLDNRKTQMVQPPAEDGQSPEVTSYSYDLNGNLVSTTDPRGYTTSYV